MDLSTVHHGVRKRKAKKRVGRGPGSGHGKTSTRGAKGQFDKFGHRMGGPGPHHIVLRLLLREHHVHRLHIVAGKSPVAPGRHVAEPQHPVHAELDPCHAKRHLARDEFRAPAGGLVVEQNSRNRIHAIGLAVVLRKEMAVCLGHPVGAARVKRCPLVLR